MKYLIFVVAIFAISNYVKAECSDEEAKAVKECYTKFQKATNKGNEHHTAALRIGDDKEFCGKIFKEHQECLQNGPKCFFDLSVKEMAKMFDTNTTEIFKILFMEYSSKYACSQKYTSTPEDNKCFATITSADIGKECEHPKNCGEFKEFPTCLKKMLISKCKNEEVSTIYADAMGYALKNLLTKCK